MRRNLKKPVALLTAALTAASLLAGCGSSAGESTDAGAQVKEPLMQMKLRKRQQEVRMQKRRLRLQRLHIPLLREEPLPTGFSSILTYPLTLLI